MTNVDRPLDPIVTSIEYAARAALDGHSSDAEAALGTIPSELILREDRSNIPFPTQVAVFRRDGFVCRYCGKLTLFVPTLRLMSRLYPQLLPFQKNWKRGECHPVFWTHSASCDHIVPLARNGSSAPDNLATACYMCNDMKSQWLLSELRWNLADPSVEGWDGLSALYPSLFAASHSQQDAYFRNWLRALI